MERCIGRVFAVAVCLLGLVSCGGGGGGGSTGNNGEISNDPSLVITADKSRFDFVGFNAVTTPIDPQTVNFTVTAGTGTYYGDVQADRPADFSARFTVTGPAQAYVSLQPLRRDPGTQSGSLTFRLCHDTGCSKVAWTKTMPYTVTVFGIETTSLTLSGFEGAQTQPATVVVSPADTARKLAVTASMSSGTGWLTVGRAADSSITVTADGSAVGSGSYQGKVRVTFAAQPDWPAVDVPVSFSVGDGLVAPAAATVDLGLNATMASMTATVPLDFKGAQSPSWTASSDQAWLVLRQTSGKGSGTLEYTVDPAKTQDIANWSSATAKVTIAAPGMKDRSFAVTLNKKLPEIQTVWPNLMREGAGGPVRVTGRGLSQLAGVQQIRVGTLSGITGSVASDTTATLTLPALPPGRTEISVPNAAGLATPSTLIARALPSPSSAASIATTGEKQSSLFDPSRNAFFTLNRAQNALVRWTLASGQWQRAELAVADIGDMAMTRDRRSLYVVSGDKQLLAIDPDTLQVRKTHTLPPPTQVFSTESLAPRSYQTLGLPVTNDLRIWFGANPWGVVRYFDLPSDSFGAQQSIYSNASSGFYGSGDGSVMWISRSSPPGEIYSPVSHFLAQDWAMPVVRQLAIFSDDGSRVIVDNEKLYRTSDYSVIGSLPGIPWMGTTWALSPDGRRVYRMAVTGTDSISVDHIDIFDATRTLPGSSELVKLGEMALPAQAAFCGYPRPQGCNSLGALSISPLGDTLFWIGNQALVVMPIPAGMSDLKASAGPRLLPAAAR